MDPRAIDLYNDFIHGQFPRREFLRRLAGIAGSAAAATTLAGLLEPNYAEARQVETDDPRLLTGRVTYAGSDGPVSGYLARPAKQSGPLPGVLVIHENRGLNAHIEDVARRAALAGYVALAPDGLSYAGGAPEDQEAARDLFGNSDRERITADVMLGVPWLAAHKDCTGKVGTVGFCYGGGVALLCAARQPATAAAVCFYGRGLDEEDVAKVGVPLMMHYGGTDERVNAGIPAFRTLLDQHEVAYSLHMYPGAGHGFHNDASEARYDEAAARLAWQRTLNLFGNYLD